MVGARCYGEKHEEILNMLSKQLAKDNRVCELLLAIQLIMLLVRLFTNLDIFSIISCFFGLVYLRKRLAVNTCIPYLRFLAKFANGWAEVTEVADEYVRVSVRGEQFDFRKKVDTSIREDEAFIDFRELVCTINDKRKESCEDVKSEVVA